MPNININFKEDEYKWLRRHKGKLTWKELLLRIAHKDAPWRLEEVEYHLDRIVQIVPQAKAEIEQLKSNIKRMLIRED